MTDGTIDPDWRYDKLRRHGEQECQMAIDLADTREAIARMVKALLPHHAPKDQINEVIEASGYSCT